MFDEQSLLEKLYFHELDRKEQLERSTTLPAGVIVANFGLIGFFFTHYGIGKCQSKFHSIMDVFFLSSTLASAVVLCVAAYWCVRAVTGSVYEYLPGTETIRSYRQALEAWHKTVNARKWKGLVAAEFAEYLADSIAKCNQRNWQTNLVRSEELYRTKRFVAFSLCTLAISAMTYYMDFWFCPSTVAGS